MALNLARQRRDDGGGSGGPPSPAVRLTVHDARERNVARFLERAAATEGVDADAVSTAADLAAVGTSRPDFVVTSLPACAASEAVVGGIVRSLPPPSADDDDGGGKGGGCVFVDTSTIGPNVSKRLHALVTSASDGKNDYVDAPVSGGVAGASAATLTFMVGASSPETLASTEPLLLRMGTRVIPCGGPGAGSAVKLCNNAALAAQMIGICEAMTLGESLGVDPEVLADAMNAGTARCWSSVSNNPHPAAARSMGRGASANGYEGGFGAALMLKDLNLAVAAGEEEGLALPAAGLSRDLYKMAALHGYGEKDFGVMLDFLKGNR